MSVPNPILKTGESFVLLERVLGGGIESLVKLASSAMDGDVALGHCRLMGKSNEYVFKGGLEFVDVPIIDAVWGSSSLPDSLNPGQGLGWILWSKKVAMLT